MSATQYDVLSDAAPDSHHNHHHHHGGMLSIIMRHYSRMLHALFLLFFESKQAGRVASNARFVRLASNIAALGGIAWGVMVLGLKTFIEADLFLIFNSLPHMLVFSAIAVNMLAITIGAAANHVKIGPRYEEEADVHNYLNQEKEVTKKESLPHGLREYWEKDRPKAKMVAIRRVHDFNGFSGTVLSLVLSIAAIGLFNLGFGAVLGIFVTTRASALLSATGAFYSNHYRLNCYLNSIFKKQEEHLDILATKDNSRHQKTDGIINEVFKNTTKHYYTKLLRYRFFMATYEYLKINSEVKDRDIINSLDVILKEYTKDDMPLREKLMLSDSVLSSLQFIGNRVFTDLCKKHSDTSTDECDTIANQAQERWIGNDTDKPLLSSYLRRELTRHKVTHRNTTFESGTQDAIAETFTKENLHHVTHEFEAGAHAEGFVSAVHTRGMCVLFSEAIAKANCKKDGAECSECDSGTMLSSP